MLGMKTLHLSNMMKLRCDYLLNIFVVTLFCLFNVSLANAAYQRGYLNLGFETPTIATGSNVCRVYISSTRVPGWLTTHPYGNEGILSNKVCVDNCPIYNLPNTFTPNNNGQNDLYTPIFPYRFVEKIDMKIYNRWGNLVFETTNPDINWNGNDYKTGKPLFTGVYYYVCDVFYQTIDGVQKTKKPLSGYIHLFRE